MASKSYSTITGMIEIDELAPDFVDTPSTPRSPSPYHDNEFKAVRDAFDVHEVIETKGKLSQALAVLVPRSRQQRGVIVKTYKDAHSSDLFESLTKLFKKRQIVTALKILSEPFDVAYCYLLQECIKGKISALVVMLVFMKSKKELEQLCETYRTTFNKTLLEDVSKAFDHEIRDLVLNHTSDKESVYEEEDPSDVAKRFTENVKKKKAEEIVYLFSTTSAKFLLSFTKHFKELTDREFLEFYKDKFKSPDMYKVLSTILDMSTDPSLTLSRYIAENIERHSTVMFYLILLMSDSRVDEIVAKYPETDSASLISDCEKIYRDEESKYILSEILKPYRKE